jgi:hypothetical protein
MYDNPEEVSMVPKGFSKNDRCRDNIYKKNWGMGWPKGKGQHIREDSRASKQDQLGGGPKPDHRSVPSGSFHAEHSCSCRAFILVLKMLARQM